MLVTFDRHIAPDDPENVPPAPEEWWISQVCDAFHIPPIVGGALDQPIQLVSRILSLRSYKTAHDLVTGAIPCDPEKIPQEVTDLVDKVKTRRIEWDLWYEARDAWIEQQQAVRTAEVLVQAP